MSLLPIFLKLDEARVLVVGGGFMAEPKISALVEAGATVEVVAPTVTQRIAKGAAAGRIQWHARCFEASDISGNVLVFAATGIAAVDREVARHCREQNILCNAIDDPAYCDFYSPAVMQRGDLQIAVSTNCKSPALAQQIRQRLEEQFDEGWAERLDDVGKLRQRVMAEMPRGEHRTQLLRKLAEGAFQDEFDGEDPEGRGSVYFVGAGPGALDLLTVRAMRLLQRADVVLHDELAPPKDFEKLLRADAVVINVGRRCGRAGVPRDLANTLMVHYARAKRRVVRLKCGDPAMFARLGEEMDALRAAEIDFEIVPGVTAALAAASAAQISLTDRRFASSVQFATAHLANRQQQDWSTAIEQRATLVIYMPGRDYGALAASLMASGASGETPCAVISNASTAGEEICAMTLDAMAEYGSRQAPSIVIVGDTVRTVRASAQFLVTAGMQASTPAAALFNEIA